VAKSGHPHLAMITCRIGGTATDEREYPPFGAAGERELPAVAAVHNGMFGMIASYSDHVECEHLGAALVANFACLARLARRNLTLTRRSYWLASRSQSGSVRVQPVAQRLPVQPRWGEGLPTLAFQLPSRATAPHAKPAGVCVEIIFVGIVCATG
jgi:hypothetical protein